MLQSVCVLSATEVGNIALEEASKEVIWLRGLVSAFGKKQVQ